MDDAPFIVETRAGDPLDNRPLYDRDFYAWTIEQAKLLRARRFDAADIENIIEEIESLGRSEKRELVSRLAVLMLHLLKWRFQPDLRTRSWQSTIRVQRRSIERHLSESPSLSPGLGRAMELAYEDGRDRANAETGLAASTFPESCPWSFEQMIDEGFWPT